MSEAAQPGPVVIPSKGLVSRAKAWVLGRILLILFMAVRIVPNPLLPGLGNRLGDALFFASAKLRRVTLKNLRQVFESEWSEEQIRCVARQVFRNFGQTAVEFVCLPRMSREELRSRVRIDGLEHLKQALKAGKGVILISAHYGNWELMGARIAQEGVGMNVLARAADDGLTDRIVNDIRDAGGYRVFARGGSLMPVLRCLRQNEAVGMLIDQNFRTGIFVDFFGRPAATASGAAEIALRTGATVLSAFVERQEDDTHLAVLSPLEIERTGDHERDVVAVTQYFTKVIEDAVRRRPDQWMWFHDRWKFRPPDDVTPGNGTSPGAADR
jgi:Kdo2-lipid IVA lauroyltransferase/acyltransferase